MQRQKLITIHKEQVYQLAKGNYGDFIKSMVKIVSSLHTGEEITSIQGPYKNEEDNSLLLVMNIKSDDHVGQQGGDVMGELTEEAIKTLRKMGTKK